MSERSIFRLKLPFGTALLIVILTLSQSGCGLKSEVLQASPSVLSTSYPTSTKPPMPDLVVGSVEVVSNSDSICPSPGQIYQVQVRVENRGDAPAGPFVTRLEVDEQLVGEGLQPGETADLLFPYSGIEGKGMVDATGLVIESDESNNQINARLDLPTQRPECIATATPEIKTSAEKAVLQGHTAAVLDVEFSPDGKTLASASQDDTVRLWSVSQARLLRTMQGHPFPVTRLKFSPSGSLLVTGSTDIRIWQVATGLLNRTLTGHTGYITALDISGDGRWIASSAEDDTVRLWLLSNGIQLQIIDEGMSGVRGLVFSPDSSSLAWGEVDGTVRLRSTGGKWLFTPKAGYLPVRCLAYTPDGRYLVSGSEDGLIRLWSTSAGKLLQTLRGHSKPVSDLAFSPNGRWLVTASEDGTLNLWQYEEGQLSLLPVVIYEGHIAPVTSVAFSLQSDLIASSSQDGTVRLWDVPKQLIPP